MFFLVGIGNTKIRRLAVGVVSVPKQLGRRRYGKVMKGLAGILLGGPSSFSGIGGLRTMYLCSWHEITATLLQDEAEQDSKCCRQQNKRQIPGDIVMLFQSDFWSGWSILHSRWSIRCCPRGHGVARM